MNVQSSSTLDLPSFCREPATIDTALMQSASIITIDGDTGAGKSSLGKELAQRLGGEHVEVDSFLLGNREPYLKQLNKEDLTAHLEAIRQHPIIVEGILLLDVLDNLQIRADYLVFAKKFINGQREQDKYLLYPDWLPRAQCAREIAEYYRRQKPWLKANLAVTLHISTGL